jgi:TolB-like protein/Flp pilus assembly protein TadD
MLNMSTPIFISYSSRDRDTALAVCQALEHRGLNCWISCRDIAPGENFQVSIVRAIRAAKVMILVFSANSNKSEEIKKELVLAGQSQLIVIPVRVEDVTPDEAFAYELATRQWVDLFSDWEDAIQRLVRQLAAMGDVAGDTGTEPSKNGGAGPDKSTRVASESGTGSLRPRRDEPTLVRAGLGSFRYFVSAAVVLVLGVAGIVAGKPAKESGNSSNTSRILSGRFAERMFRRNRATIFSAGVVAIAATIGIGGLPMWHQPPLLYARASIMVLPFRNLNGPGEDYFANAVTDALTTDLSRLSDTMVIARATAFTYKGRPVDVREFRREFGVRYVLAGSIEKIGSKVQANAELIDTSSTSSLWAERFQSELTDPFELQEAITGRIAASLHLQLVRAESRRTIAERTTDPDAYDLRSHAMAYLIDKITPENTLAARRALEKSLALDPNSAEAWSELAHVMIIDVFRSWNNATTELLVQAEEAVRKAYAIDRSVALAHFAEGKIHQLKGDFQRALDALSEALQLDPNLAMAYAQKTPDLIYLGRAQEAPALVTKAIDLSPRDPDLGLFYWFKGHAYFAMKDYDNAIHWVQKSVEERPAVWSSRAYLISAYALTGRLGQREAQAAVHEYSNKFNNWPLDPKIKEWAGDKRFRDAHPDYKAALQEFLKGLQIAKETADFP